ITEDISGSLRESLKMGVHIRKQELEIAALMIMRDHPPRDAPEPFNTVGIGIISRRIDQIEVLLELGEQAAYQQGSRRSVRLEIVSNHDSDSSATLGAGNGHPQLFTEHIGGASRSDLAIEPAIAPVHQAKAVDLAIIPRSLD